MPIVTVKFVSHHDRSVLSDLDVALRTVILHVRSLELKPGDITCVFPVDVFDGERDEVIVEVTGLFSGENRTASVRKMLAKEIVATIVHFFCVKLRDHLRQVECFVHEFDPKQGFASSQ